MPAASADLLPKLVISGKGGQEHGQDRLSGGQGDLDPVGWTDLVWDELDQLCKHTQGMEMRFRQAVELFAMFVDGRECFPSTRLKKYLVIVPTLSGSQCEPIYRASP